MRAAKLFVMALLMTTLPFEVNCRILFYDPLYGIRILKPNRPNVIHKKDRVILLPDEDQSKGPSTTLNQPSDKDEYSYHCLEDQEISQNSLQADQTKRPTQSESDQSRDLNTNLNRPPGKDDKIYQGLQDPEISKTGLQADQTRHQTKSESRVTQFFKKSLKFL